MSEPAHEIFSFDDEASGLGPAQETQRALIDTQERMGMMLDIMPMGLLIHTRQGVLFANQEACSMLQIGKSQVIGHHLLDFVGADEFDAVNRQLEDSFDNETSMHKRETTIIHSDGTSICIVLLSCRLPWQGTPVIQVLLQDVTDLKMKEEKLRHLTITDELTGAFNRRHLFDCAAMHLERARDDRDFAVSVVSLDIDHFKKINDTYGHAVGDLALKRLAEVGRELVGRDCADGMFCRIGGEEFLLLLPGMSQQAAANLAERLRLLVASLSIKAPGGTVKFTASMGVASCRRSDRGLDAALSRADHALYQAKHAGRNRVVAA